MARRPRATQAKANPHRGEHVLTLGGEAYLLRPSFGAITAIEQATESSLLDLVRLGDVGHLTFDQLGVIAAELIRAGADEGSMNRRVSSERLAEMIYEEGVTEANARLTLCLVDAASGGRTASGEAKAADVNRPKDTSAA